MAALAAMRNWRGAVNSDEELIAEVLGGRTAAFAELTSRHREKVERLCQRFFSDREMARDLAQESLMRAFTGLATYRAEMPFSGWLRAITANVCYDELRRRQRRPEDLVGDFGAAEQNWTQLVNQATPEDIVNAAEQRREAYDLAHRLLDTLKPDDRMVMVLKETEELSVSEIAEVMGWSVAKVKIRAFRARQLMRARAEKILSSHKGRVAR
jgi:RNA polymerase sigma-70 factor (ECF subfamily)